MKVFIVFIALLIVNMTFITYQGDLNRYVRLQTFMKAVAEEAAAGAALYYDEVAYSNGSMVINREEGEKYIEYLLTRAEQTLDLKEGESLTAEMEVMDDGSGATEQYFSSMNSRAPTARPLSMSLPVSAKIRSNSFSMLSKRYVAISG